jgi:hypothetical protein
MAQSQSSHTVQALASQGGEIALDDTFVFDIACSNQRMMSPSLCGSDPYPCGSLTYRTILSFPYFHVYIMPKFCRCQPTHLREKSKFERGKYLVEQIGIWYNMIFKENGILCGFSAKGDTLRGNS